LLLCERLSWRCCRSSESSRRTRTLCPETASSPCATSCSMRSVVCRSLLNLMTILSRSLSGWPGWGQSAQYCRRTKTTLHSPDWCQTRSMIEFLELRQHQQVAAVVTAKGRIAASTYRITLTHARYSLWAGRCPQIAPLFPWVYPVLTYNTFLGPTWVYYVNWCLTITI